MTTIKEVKNFFENGFGNNTGVIKSLDFNSPDNFTADLRCKISEEYGTLTMDDYKEFIKSFIQKFSELTMTNWLFRKSYPAVSHRLYRKIYVCQQASFRKGKFVHSKSDNCEAKINVSIKMINENTLGDPLLQDGYDIIININNTHSHVIHEPNVIRCDAALDEKFIEFFENGMTPAVSRRLHQTRLMEEHESNIMKILSNPQINPTDRHIQYLYTKWRENRADQTCKSCEEFLEEMRIKYSEHTFVYKRDSVFVILLSQLMKRAAKVADFNTIFIDSSCPSNQKESYVTFIYTHSNIGAMPVACVLHTEQTDQSYTVIFTAVKEALEQMNPNLKLNPYNIFTDDVISARKALAKVFPESRLLLFSFHLCQTLWGLLCDPKHKVDSERRQAIMVEFRKIVFAEDIGTAQMVYEELIKDSGLCSLQTPTVLEYLIGLWKKRSEWIAAFYKNDRLPEGYNPKNFTETTIRVFKDIIHQRCRAFNIPPLVEFICSIHENYHIKRIMSYVKTSQNVPYDYTRLLSVGEDIANIYRINNNEFKVESDCRQDCHYTVRLDLGFCDCINGKSGSLCKHLCYIEEKYGVTFKKSFNLAESDRLILARIAMGDDVDLDAIIKQELETTEHITDNEQNAGMFSTTKRELPDSLSESCDLGISLRSADDSGSMHEAAMSCDEESDSAATSSTISNKRTRRAPIVISETLDLDEFENAILDFNKEFTRLSNLFKQDPTTFNLKAVQKLTCRLKNINSPADAHKFIFQDIKFNGKNFKYSLSRRRTTAQGATKPNTRLQTREEIKK